MSKRKAIVVGGGIAGPASAIFLQRVGFEAVVYEARPGPSDREGAFLNIAPNGLHVLRELGLLERVREQGFDCPVMIFRNAAGRELGRMQDDLAARSDGLGSVIIRRGLLHALLCEEALRNGVGFEHGKRLDDLTMESEGAPVVGFTDGTEARADLLLGCDGLHSRTRRLLFPGAPEPEYTGMIDCGGFAVLPDAPPADGAMNFVFGKRAFFGYFVAPSGEVYWFQNTACEAARLELVLRSSDDAWQRNLRELHSDDAAPVPDILSATAGAVGRWPLHDMPPLRSWYWGSACLLGDAAHAVSPHGGNGASLALEDAVVLAKCIRDCRDDRQAFATYMEARKGRVERIARRARKNGNMKGRPSRAGAWLRDLLMPLFLRGGSRAVSEIHDYRVEWGADYPSAASPQAHRGEEGCPNPPDTRRFRRT